MGNYERRDRIRYIQALITEVTGYVDSKFLGISKDRKLHTVNIEKITGKEHTEKSTRNKCQMKDLVEESKFSS